jgi:hypothetical protein
MKDNAYKSETSNSRSNSSKEKTMNPKKYLNCLNITYGGLQFQDKMNYKTQHDRCGFPRCDIDHKLRIC